jgi:hypothetical protein
VAEDLTLADITATGLTGSVNPVVSWNDLGFRKITVKNCDYSK